MAYLGFIDGTPDRISIQQLIDGAREALDIIEDGNEDEPIWSDRDRSEAQLDLDGLSEILAELGYAGREGEEIVDALESVARETSGEFVEYGSLTELALSRYEDPSWSSLISSNINWSGVVDDMIEGVYEMTINNGTYYDA